MLSDEITPVETPAVTEKIRPAAERTWPMSRRVIRLLWVGGLLALVAAWRLDQAVATAYTTHWVAPHSNFVLRAQAASACTGCWRLPGHGWVLAYTAIGSLALALLALAAVVYAWRRYTAIGEGVTVALIGLGVAALAAAALAAFFRYRTGSGDGDQTGLATTSEILGLAAVALAAVAVAVARPDADVTQSFAARTGAFLRTQSLPLIVGVLFAALLLVVGQTSGQAIDSLRTWDTTTARGLSRIGFSTAAAFVLALVFYEIGLRAIQQARKEPKRRAMNPLFWLAATLVFALGWWPGPFGNSFGVLAGIAFAIFLLDLPRFGDPAPNRTAWRATDADDHTAEYAAVVPLLAIAAAAVTAAVEGGLAGHARLAGLGPLVPTLILGVSAVLLTGEGPRPTITRASAHWAWAFPAIVIPGVALTLLGAEFSRHAALVAASVCGALAAIFCVAYAVRLFWRPWSEGDSHGAAAITIAGAAGLSLVGAVYFDTFGASPALGTFALVCVGLAFFLALFSVLGQIARRYRAPTLLWWLGARRFPLVTLLVIAWLGAGLVAPNELHNVQLVPRQEVDGAPPSTPRLEDAFYTWVAAQPELNGHDDGTTEGPVPMLLVAAHGGGIKAAYWTDIALDCLIAIRSTGMNLAALQSDDDVERQATCKNNRRTPAEQRTAARRVFLASGVSGGAVGLYVYSRQLLGSRSLADDWVHARLGHDFASPTIGWALFHDIPNHILGLHLDGAGTCPHPDSLKRECMGADRGAVIADSFDRWFKDDADATFDPDLRLTWDMRSSSNGAFKSAAELVPLLIDNSTVTGGKARAVASAANLGMWPQLETENPAEVGDFPLAGTAEVSDALCGDEDISLSTAAILAARFPYVSPSGRIAGNCRGAPSQKNADCALASAKTCQMRLVDGGYAENSGLFTIDALWPKLRQLVVAYNTGQHARMIAPVIVELDNHYRASEPSQIPGSGTGLETIVPPTTGFGAHGAMETFARALAYRLRPRDCTVTISPGLHPGLTAPLGWELSDAAQQDLRHALVEPHPVESGRVAHKDHDWAAALQLRTVQQWISAGSEPPIPGRPLLSKCAPTTS